MQGWVPRSGFKPGLTVTCSPSVSQGRLSAHVLVTPADWLGSRKSLAAHELHSYNSCILVNHVELQCNKQWLTPFTSEGICWSALSNWRGCGNARLFSGAWQIGAETFFLVNITILAHAQTFQREDPQWTMNSQACIGKTHLGQSTDLGPDFTCPHLTLMRLNQV